MSVERSLRSYQYPDSPYYRPQVGPKSRTQRFHRRESANSLVRRGSQISSSNHVKTTPVNQSTIRSSSCPVTGFSTGFQLIPDQVRCSFPYSQELLKSMTELISKFDNEHKGKRVKRVELIVTRADASETGSDESSFQMTTTSVSQLPTFLEESANQSRASIPHKMTPDNGSANDSEMPIDEAQEPSSSSEGSVAKEDFIEDDEHAAETPQGGDDAVDEPTTNGVNTVYSSESEDSDESSEEAEFVVGESYEVRPVTKRGRRSTLTPAERTCIECNELFSSKMALKMHQKEHAKEGAFSCDLCSRSFTRPAYLKRHMTAHNEDRPFSCNSCDRTFKEKRNLARHSRSHGFSD